MSPHREGDVGHLDEPTLITHERQQHAIAMTPLQAQHGHAVMRYIQRYAISDGDTQAITQGVWNDLQRRLINSDLSPSSSDTFVEHLTLITMMKYYSAPEHRDAALTTTLSSALQNMGSSPELDEECAELLLVLRAQAGEVEAFNEWWIRHQKVIVGWIRARVSPGGSSDAHVHEILNETFMDLRTKALPRYDPSRSRFRTYAKSYAENRIKQFYTREKKIRERELLGNDIVPTGDTQEDPEPWEERVPSEQPSVEAATIGAEQANRLLQTTFTSTSPPHQVIIFGFNRLLTWPPRDIVADLSDCTLRTLETKLEDDLMDIIGLGPTTIRECLRKLRDDMHVTFGALVSHPKTREAHQTLLERIAGDIVLRELYTKDDDPEDNVAKWANNVWRSIRVRMLEEVLGPVPNISMRETPSTRP
jgi:DNA-directed RNA polymerase specialized sigma24 family protein